MVRTKLCWACCCGIDGHTVLLSPSPAAGCGGGCGPVLLSALVVLLTALPVLLATLVVFLTALPVMLALLPVVCGVVWSGVQCVVSSVVSLVWSSVASLVWRGWCCGTVVL
jgi:hypothetical protein